MDGGDRLEFPVRPAVVMAVVGLVPAPPQLASFDRRNISAWGKTERAGPACPDILLAQQSLRLLITGWETELSGQLVLSGKTALNYSR